MVSTTLVALLKSENSGSRPSRRRQNDQTQGVMETYKLLFSIVRLPTVFTFCCLLLTSKVPAVPASSGSNKKCIIILPHCTEPLVSNLLFEHLWDELERRDSPSGGC